MRKKRSDSDGKRIKETRKKAKKKKKGRGEMGKKGSSRIIINAREAFYYYYYIFGVNGFNHLFLNNNLAVPSTTCRIVPSLRPRRLRLRSTRSRPAKRITWRPLPLLWLPTLAPAAAAAAAAAAIAISSPPHCCRLLLHWT